MSQHFTHLHLHTEFSLLDGAIKLDQLIQFGKNNNAQSLAITDHGNIFGAVKFFQKCKKAGIKPILGMEAYTTPDVSIKNAEKKYHHMIILVQNEIGYRNLCKLISFSFKEGFYFKPRIDYATLEKYNEGLIVTSGCLGGHIPQLLLNDRKEEALKQVDWFLKVFGPERFYFEVQPEDQEEQKVVNDLLFEIGKEKGVQVVATGDCHYASLDDKKAHDVMLCIQTHHKITDPKRFSFGKCEPWMRNAEQMLECFPNNPEAIWNSGKIADMCNFDFQTDKLFFPVFEIPKEHSQETFFKELCFKGLEKLIERGAVDPEDKDKYVDRLNIEIDLITSMGFIGYFLVVSDFIMWARANGIPVGPGRGSAAGSLIAWTLEITNIDPLRYNLLFERFLNPERVSMPDIDIDFCIQGRDTVIQYVRDKYGHDNVCNIITFGTMLAKGVLKDVGRALGFPFEDANALTNLIPDQLKITLKEAREQEPEIQNLIDSNFQVAELFNIAHKLEGLTRHASKHAAGIVISPQPIDEVLPVYIPPKSNELVTQYAMTELESLGFLKIDFLGLKNLTLIDKALRLIKKNKGIDIDIDKIPLDDAKAFELICAGNTSGVFQLESDGLKDVLRKLQPDKFEDIIAVNALYRPGPLGSGMVDDFIERRHGRQKFKYHFDDLKPILEETYGVIVYQEQVMKLASQVGGYSLGEADILRRAMGKKKVDVMAEQREIFLKRSKEKGYEAKKSAELFDLMAYFAGYGFNKSHSAAYALIAYQTAYLKANHAAEFMACLITLESTNADKMSFYLEETRAMDIELLPPDINRSEIDFAVLDGKILFGLKGIKSVGLAALENIVTEREEKPFADLLDFCTRIDLRTSNKRVIEHLIFAGAFDKLPGNRAQQFEEVSAIMDQAIAKKRALETGQMGLFDIGNNSDDEEDPLYTFEPKAEWADKEKLDKEKEVIGFYMSAHPLDSYRNQIKRFGLPAFETILDSLKQKNPTQEPVVTGFGLLKNVKIITTKKGDKMAFATLEDARSEAEIIIFPRQYKKVAEWLNEYQVFIVKGGLDLTSFNKCKIKANLMVPLELFYQEWSDISFAQLQLPLNFASAKLAEIDKSSKNGKVPLELIFQENGKKVRLKTKKRIGINQEYIEAIEECGIQVKLGI
ncbi:DNA polymerase III subunit alpha [bacterium]|jgi:DNA polymerase III subunit alpha|nr:DNA polymerase III subunit alpha [bacterium]MBT5015314.1 DNA polymerase III subunit alpha [bacterium]